jgi:hypothetical protein
MNNHDGRQNEKGTKGSGNLKIRWDYYSFVKRIKHSIDLEQTPIQQRGSSFGWIWVDLQDGLLRHRWLLLLLLLGLEDRRIIDAKYIKVELVQRCRPSYGPKPLVDSA